MIVIAVVIMGLWVLGLYLELWRVEGENTAWRRYFMSERNVVAYTATEDKKTTAKNQKVKSDFERAMERQSRADAILKRGTITAEEEREFGSEGHVIQ